MKRMYRAYFQTQATTSVGFTADVDGLTDEQAKAKLRQAAAEAFGRQADTTLCHHCCHKVELGDFDLGDDEDAIEEVSA